MEMNESEPIDDVSKADRRCRNYANRRAWDKTGGQSGYWPVGIRHIDGMNMTWALVRNMGTCRCDVKGETQVSDPHQCESTDAQHRGGRLRSSDEAE